jgi:colanic acid/amylovoran biosynthesis glycosyltransferase
LIKWKGHAYGIKAVSLLVKKGYNISYIIIGEGEEKTNLKNLIKSLNLEKNVVLTGAKDQQFIRDHLQQSDIFLMTSTHDETGRRETQGVVTGEAQACGLPVCAFNSGGVPYTMVDGETGFLSEEKDIKGMADNIEKLIVNQELRKKMSNNARNFVVEHYSLKSSAAKMQNIYQKLLS